MKFNKRAIQRELDLAAEELEKHGYIDLADKVDRYTGKLMDITSAKEIPIIRRALARVEREADRRQAGNREITSRKELKSKESVRKSRRTSEQKENRRRRLEDSTLAEKRIRSHSDRVDKLLEEKHAGKDEYLEDLRDRIKERRAAKLKKDRRERLAKSREEEDDLDDGY